MSPSGQATHIGLGKETIWGTPQGASDYIKFSSETLTLAIEELIASSLSVKRDEPESFEGLGSIAGNTVHEVHPNALGYLLRSWFGKVLSTNPTGTVYKHIFTPGIDKEAKGTADSGTDVTLVDADLVTTDDEFNGCWLHIISGTNAGFWRIITDSEASSNTVTVSPAFPLAIDNTSVYEIRNGPEHCILPPYSLEIHRDLPAKAFQFSGCVPNTLAFSFGVGAKILNLTATWLGKDVALIDPTTPSWEPTEPFRWNQAILLIGVYDTGTGTSGNTTTSINCPGKTYTVDALIGKYVRITSGNMQDQIRKIVSNGTTRLNWTEETAAAPDDASTYEVWDEENLIETLSLSLSNGLIPVPLLNNTKRIAKIVGDVFRSGTISPTFHVEDRTNWETYFKGWATQPWLVVLRGALRTSTKYYYELQFHLPKILFTAYPLSTAGPGRLTVGATGKIKYDSTAAHQYLAKVILFNSKQVYA